MALQWGDGTTTPRIRERMETKANGWLTTILLNRTVCVCVVSFANTPNATINTVYICRNGIAFSASHFFLRQRRQQRLKLSEMKLNECLFGTRGGSIGSDYTVSKNAIRTDATAKWRHFIGTLNLMKKYSWNRKIHYTSKYTYTHTHPSRSHNRSMRNMCTQFSKVDVKITVEKLLPWLQSTVNLRVKCILRLFAANLTKWNSNKFSALQRGRIFWYVSWCLCIGFSSSSCVSRSE